MHTNWFGEASFGLEKQEFGENEIFEFGQWRLIFSRLLLWVRESSGKWTKDRPQCLFFKSCQSEGNWLITPTAHLILVLLKFVLLLSHFQFAFSNILLTSHFPKYLIARCSRKDTFYLVLSISFLSHFSTQKKKKKTLHSLSLFLNKEFYYINLTFFFWILSIFNTHTRVEGRRS